MPSTVRLASLALLGLALSACSSIARVPLDEAAELATMGRERPLREPMRPVRGAPRVLVLALDGVGHDDLMRAVREGRLPHLAALLGPEGEEGVFARGYAVPDAIAILPTATTPGWVSLFTGRPPAETGVPGNEWFVREERTFYAPVPISVGSRDHATRLFTDELLSDLVETPTVFERLDLRAHVSMNPVFRGADLLTLPNLSTFGDLVEQMATGVAGGGSGSDPDVHRETDETSVRSLVGALEDYGVPDLQVAYFPGPDLVTHQAESPLESQQRYLAGVTDTAVARVLEAYEAAGALEETYVVVLSDHGHTPVLDDDRHSLGGEGEGEPPRVLEEAGFRVRPFSLHTDDEAFQAVLAYQGTMAFVYLADRSTCPAQGERCEWARPPRFEEDVLPVARGFFAASRDPASEMHGAIDLVLARRPVPVGEDALPLEVFDGEWLVPVGEYLRRHPRPELLRLEERLHGLSAGPYGHRAGDVLLLARSGAESPLEERFHFSAPSHSDHGGAHAQDSRVPILVAHPGRSGTEIAAIVRGALGARPSQLGVADLLEALLRR